MVSESVVGSPDATSFCRPGAEYLAIPNKHLSTCSNSIASIRGSLTRESAALHMA